MPAVAGVSQALRVMAQLPRTLLRGGTQMVRFSLVLRQVAARLVGVGSSGQARLVTQREEGGVRFADVRDVRADGMPRPSRSGRHCEGVCDDVTRLHIHHPFGSA